MNKSTKGAVAAAAAAILLVGGAGTLAYWNATGSVDGDDISSGKLALINPGAQTWTLNGDAADGTVVLVPGDELVYAGSYEIDAAGDNLVATLGIAGGTETGGLSAFVDTSVDAVVDGATVTDVTAADDGKRIDVRATVDFPFGTSVDNASQSQTLNLSDLTITLTQTDASPDVP